VPIKETLKTGNWLNRLRRWRSEVIVWRGKLRILGIAVDFREASSTEHTGLAPTLSLQRASQSR
jgi:hypothetical protein